MTNTQLINLKRYQTSYPDRCHQCYMREEHCLCSELPQIQNKTPLTIIMHHRESWKTTNTARLANLCLKNSEVYLRGLKNNPLEVNKIIKKDHIPLFLTLHDHSKTLSPELLSSLTDPFQLIVPDGNWRQASKVGKREAELKNTVWVKLPAGLKSSYQLRHEHLDEGLATIEAIARAYGIIESPLIQSELEAIFNKMVSRTLSTRPPKL